MCASFINLSSLKQAVGAWFHRLPNFLLWVGFCASKFDHSLFIYNY